MATFSINISDEMYKELDGMNKKLDEINKKLDEINKKLDEINKKLDQLELNETINIEGTLEISDFNEKTSRTISILEGD